MTLLLSDSENSIAACPCHMRPGNDTKRIPNHKFGREAYSLTPAMIIGGTQQAGILCNVSHNGIFSAEVCRTLLLALSVDSPFYKLRVNCCTVMTGIVWWHSLEHRHGSRHSRRLARIGCRSSTGLLLPH